MESIIVMVNLFGAVALLLFGLSQVKDGATRAFGIRLRTGLAQGDQRAGAIVRRRLRRNGCASKFDRHGADDRILRGKGAGPRPHGANRPLGRQCRNRRHGLDRCHRHRLAVALAHSCRRHAQPGRALQCQTGCRHRAGRHRPDAVIAAPPGACNGADAAIASPWQLPHHARQCLAGGDDLCGRARLRLVLKPGRGRF